MQLKYTSCVLIAILHVLPSVHWPVTWLKQEGIAYTNSNFWIKVQQLPVLHVTWLTLHFVWKLHESPQKTVGRGSQKTDSKAVIFKVVFEWPIFIVHLHFKVLYKWFTQLICALLKDPWRSKDLSLTPFLNIPKLLKW